MNYIYTCMLYQEKSQKFKVVEACKQKWVIHLAVQLGEFWYWKGVKN